jgi:hypothetical protein
MPSSKTTRVQVLKLLLQLSAEQRTVLGEDSLVPAISNVSLNAFATAGSESSMLVMNRDAWLKYGSSTSKVESESYR